MIKCRPVLRSRPGKVSLLFQLSREKKEKGKKTAIIREAYYKLHPVVTELYNLSCKVHSTGKLKSSVYKHTAFVAGNKLDSGLHKWFLYMKT